MNKPEIKTLGELKQSGYTSRSVKEELRANLIEALKTNPDEIFKGIQGYENSVIPHLEAAILAQHNILFLGLRGQAKTKMARLMVGLLDEWMPIIHGSELNEDPLSPISFFGIETIAKDGDDTMVEWVHRSERYSEKLATPDVSVADLIGDLDPIKAANLKLTFGDERVIHFGMIPKANRGLFVINELPDLQARIQVALFNMLQEGDIQIRGFKLRFNLDVQFVFTANPEDYTNRGSIITPLKDRIESQILTHYPESIELSKQITLQEAKINQAQRDTIEVPNLLLDLLEQSAVEARNSDYVDQKSGVSARLTIAAYELLNSNCELRCIKNSEEKTTARISDLFQSIPALTGKMELVYEGELEGVANVSQAIIGKAIRTQFENYFPDPSSAKKDEINPLGPVIDWFNAGNTLKLENNLSEQEYQKQLKSVPGLKKLVEFYLKGNGELLKHKGLMMEFFLHGLVEYSQLSRHSVDAAVSFGDMMSGLNLDFTEEDLENFE